MQEITFSDGVQGMIEVIGRTVGVRICWGARGWDWYPGCYFTHNGTLSSGQLATVIRMIGHRISGKSVYIGDGKGHW
jgi:hypothetical protein